MFPISIAKTPLAYQPLILTKPQPAHASPQVKALTTSQNDVSPSRVKSTLERPLHIVTNKGESLGSINLPVFLRHVNQGLQDIKCPPKHIDITGGGVAYLNWPPKSQKICRARRHQKPGFIRV